MTSDFLFVAGVAVLSFALRSFRHPGLFRLGSLGIVVTSFLAGWMLGGHLWLGLVFAASWFLLPWVEILSRVRKLRIPSDRVLSARPPPPRSEFPDLAELSAEIEGEGFEHVGDVGCEDETLRQFYRVFKTSCGKTQASICLAEQGDITFYYLSVTSRLPGGKVYLTWNYPFCYGLKFSPATELNRIQGIAPFKRIIASHREFLNERGIAANAPAGLADADILEAMQKDFRSQIRHNVDIGFLREDAERAIRYTSRGMFFLWFQFLRDLMRIF